MTTSLAFGFAKLAWTLLVYKLDGEFRNAIEPDEEVVRGIVDESDVKSSVEMWKKMRPYMAIAGVKDTNPMNLRSVMVTGRAEDRPTEKEFAKKLPLFHGTPVYPLAIFEYAIENGLESIIHKHVDKEWQIGKTYKNQTWTGSNGFVNLSYLRFKENKDFLKFQESMLKELY